ncbi:MAG: SIMPL domain-containing protein [Spirochaetes bacterium]|nr:SIMPL domain-containing protein [Spirochaetota bacterium]
MKVRHYLACAAILAVGIAAAGFFIGSGFVKSRKADRFVTVKGIAERDVEPDIALWPLRFVATDDELSSAQAAIKKSLDHVIRFLKTHDIGEDSIEMQNLMVNDLLSNPYRSTEVSSRYIISQTVMVRSQRPDLIRAASQDIGDLVDAGVVLSPEYEGAGGPTYFFSRLNEIKPEMIAEATANARKAAEKFATDSGSEISGIRRANQGVFVILPRDNVGEAYEGKQYYKTVRVVSTIEYYLSGGR